MAATAEWSIPFELTTPQGVLLLNQLAYDNSSSPLGYYLLDPTGCESGANLRVVRDNEPQMSGEIMHQHYKQGYEMKLKVSLWETIGDGAIPACGEVLVAMLDYLSLMLNCIVGEDPFVSADGRIQWTPTGASVDRMLDKVRLIGEPSVTIEQPITLTWVDFSMLTPYPYVMDAPETTTAIPDITPTTLTNTGNAPFWPVVKVYGPTTFFELKNNTYLDLNGNASQIVFDSDLPGAVAVGAGDYIEFGFFRNTAYLNGNSTNMKPGINLQDSDFWPLLPGANEIEVDGATAEVLWQPAYA